MPRRPMTPNLLRKLEMANSLEQRARELEERAEALRAEAARLSLEAENLRAKAVLEKSRVQRIMDGTLHSI